MRGRIRKVKEVVPKLLDLTHIFGPHINTSLTFDVPTSRLASNRELFSELQQMKMTAATYRIGYLTANQV